MSATRGDVIFIDASFAFCDAVTGLVIPIPPRRTGRASRSLISLEHAGCPVKAGSRWC